MNLQMSPIPFSWCWLLLHSAYLHSFEDLQLDGDLQGRRSVASTIYVETNEDAVALEVKRRRYLRSPLFECSEPGLWMQLNHHDDPAMAADMEDVSPHESSTGFGIESSDLIGCTCGFAINALQNGEEVSIAVTESMCVWQISISENITPTMKN